MPRFNQMPPVLLARATWLRLSRRVHFPTETIGDMVSGVQEDYQVFRKMVVDPGLSRIPMPLIAAQPGFRSKTWMLGRESGSFKGVYEWDSVNDAKDYWTSFPMRLMKRRAVASTLTWEIRPTQ